MAIIDNNSIVDGTMDSNNVQPPSPAPEPTTPTPQNGAAKPKPPPPGYKLVRRRKEDGTLITVLRKMTPEELEAAGQKEPITAPNEGVQYKIVTVRNTDGSYTRVKRPVKSTEAVTSTATTPTPASPTQAPTPTENSSTDSIHRKVNAKTGVIVEKSLDGETAPAVQAQGSNIDMEAAIAEQNANFKKQRSRKYKQALIRGLGTIAGSAVGQMNFHDSDNSHGGHSGSHDIQDGDIIDSDNDWSDDDLDDDHHTHGQNHADDHDHSHLTATHVHLNTAGAAKTLITTAATSAANAAGSPPQKPAAAVTATGTTAATAAGQAPGPDSSGKDEKITYKVTVGALEEADRKFAEKDEERSIRRHWTNIAFYLMGSLSIVLPILFLILGAFVFPMNGKSVTSSWKVMPDVIKVAISAWPIVFAAVVAQVFKAYATWKVERGIKLMRLEQLLGSNSFGSAVKQPMVLRQLDTLSFLLLLTWCLSPLGSQALQRSYITGLQDKMDTTSIIYYLNKTGKNQVFSDGSTQDKESAQHALDNQLTGIQFLSTLLPVDQNNNSFWTDSYSHPIPWSYNSNHSLDYPLSMTGIPIILPDSKINLDGTSTSSPVGKDKLTPYEYFDFPIQTSYFNFTCGNWNLTMGKDVPNTGEGYTKSSSKTLVMHFDMGEANSNNKVMFYSANVNPDKVNITENLLWQYSNITCDFNQVFLDLQISCSRTLAESRTSDYSTVCYTLNMTTIDQNEAVKKGYGTRLEAFADDWMDMGALANSNKTARSSTPTEFFLQSNYYQPDTSTYSAKAINLSHALTASDFAKNFGLLFNTWIDIGYCPECRALADQAAYNNASQALKDRFVERNNTESWNGIDTVYTVQTPWAACYMVCTCLLLLFGVAGVIVESRTVAPDTLGYVSTVARNSRYLHLKPTSGAMSGPERARKLADTKVMLQDVKAKAGVGKIALGLKSENAVKLRYDRLYR
ncbi:hypothetical protein E8E13_000404 [Curvularia kusanoi]|uniref:Uncharacterized protein n=1 Tax=Curvularia kusanoi TaxID=90978 RepID=A0A9P4T515_CURKU|nr:hypothetical protein E8E13_000404 [Curvularia kusanoi]